MNIWLHKPVIVVVGQQARGIMWRGFMFGISLGKKTLEI
jgi:hypothetical protein